MAGLEIVAPDTPVAEMGERLEEMGYLVIEALAVEAVAAAREELLPHIEAAAFGHTDFLGDRTKRVNSVLQRSPAARELVIHPTVLALADRLLLPSCATYQLNFSGVMHLEPGAKAQVLHRDGLLYPLAHPSPPTLMPAMWALSDFTAENGATNLVPGSHRWAQEREPFEDEVAAAEMPAGSVLLYTSGILHGGGRNRSNAVRTGLALQYSLGWLRQEENQYLANPPEIARDYPERLRRLIGYDYGGPYLGFFRGDDPHRIFEPDREGPAERSRPDIDAAYDRIAPIRFGDLEPVETPRREGRRARNLKGSPT